jgi:hypothetical protein
MEQTQIKHADVITVKVPASLKKQMKQVDVNWSQYIRDCVQKKINEQKRKDAFDKLDEIRKRSKPTSTKEIVAWIREDREK